MAKKAPDHNVCLVCSRKHKGYDHLCSYCERSYEKLNHVDATPLMYMYWAACRARQAEKQRWQQETTTRTTGK